MELGRTIASIPFFSSYPLILPSVTLYPDIEVLDLLGFYFIFLKKSGFWTSASLLADEGGWRSMGFFAARQTVLQAFAWTAVTWGWQSGKDRLAQTSILWLRLWCIRKAWCSHLVGFSFAYIPEITQMALACNLLLAASANELPKWYL